MNTIKFEKGNVLVVAHRGLSGIETENTNSAFVAAGNRSYYGIETDIHRTTDGKFVVFHDSTLARVAGENIPVEEVSLPAIQAVTLFDKDGTKNRLDLIPPTLENYISICKKYEKHAVLELKTEFTDEEIEKIIDIIRGFDYLENVTFISFKYDNLVKIRKLLPSQSVQFLFKELTEEIFENVVRDKFDVDVYAKLLTEEQVKRYHDAGIKVNCYTVDDKERAEELVKMGVDFITSNILE